MTRQKRVAAVHDISGFGKCSLTVALPILSAAGIETSIMPTAVLSTHTGGFTGYTYHDLTDDLRPFTQHWKSLGLTFDALYSGFLGSFEQLEIVSEFFDSFKTNDNLIVVDPAMADNGELYSLFTPDFAAGMAKLCAKAGLIVPNITEAALMLGETYHDGPYNKEYIEKLLHGLSKLGPGKVVLTGVFFDDRELGAASFDADSGEINYSFSGRIEGFYHGTGDIFASALLAGLLDGQSLAAAAQLAVDFTQGSITRTKEAGTDVRFGVNFEAGLPQFIRQLGLL
jgi:pyridoxine kinase